MYSKIRFIQTSSSFTQKVGVGLSSLIGPTGPQGQIGGLNTQFLFNNNGIATGSFDALFFTGGNIYSGSDILPKSNAEFSLGSPSNLWKSIYISTGTIFIGPTGSLGLDNNGTVSSVAGFATPFLTVGSTNPGNGITLYNNQNSLYFQNQSGATGPVSNWNVTSSNLNNIFFTGGNVGIGTLTPNYALTVKGQIYCEGITGPNLQIQHPYGSFYDTTTQNNTVSGNTGIAMKYNSTDLSYKVSITGPNNSRILIEESGVYNIQFSAQFDKTDAGTDIVELWLSKNGTYLDWSSTMLTMSGNSAKLVAAWNLFVQGSSNDYFELMWASADPNVRIYSSASKTSPYTAPGVPSVILTLNKIS